MDEPVLLGNNLATLVAAQALACRGQRATVLSEGRPLGGHFAGLQLAEHDFDLGMVFLERPAHPAPSRDATDYQPGRRNDCARFSGLVADFIEGFAATRRVTTPQVLIDGRRHADYLIANRLDAFLGCTLPGPVQAAAAGRTHALHAAHKIDGADYDTLSYADAGAHNHGAALHAHYFERFGHKMADLPGSALLARFHRAAWLPLYYPETLLQAVAGHTAALPEYPFWLPEAGWTGSWVQALRRALAASPHVRLRADPVAAVRRTDRGFSVELDGGEVLATGRLFLGTTSERAHALLGLPTPAPPVAASVQLLLGLARQDAIGATPSCLMVVDPALQSYRLSDLDAGRDAPWHRVVVEANADRLARHAAATGRAADELLADEARILLDAADPQALRVLKSIVARQSVALPTLAGRRAAMDNLADVHDAARGIGLSGQLLALGAASMNDQIVQGLKQAEEWA